MASLASSSMNPSQDRPASALSRSNVTRSHDRLTAGVSDSDITLQQYARSQSGQLISNSTHSIEQQPAATLSFSHPASASLMDLPRSSAQNNSSYQDNLSNASAGLGSTTSLRQSRGSISSSRSSTGPEATARF